MRSRATRALRSDATRNRDAIVEATIETLTRQPGASVTQIAAAAGVSRATIYGHFASRTHLVAVALRWIAGRVDERFARVDPARPPEEALDDLVATSWWALGQLAGMTAAARWGASASDLRLLQNESRSRIEELIHRGRETGAFRSDQDLEWQTACFTAILRAGASRTRGGEPPAAEVADEMVATIRAMLAVAPGTSPADSPRPPARSVGLP